MKFPIVIAHKKFNYGYAEVIQDYEAESDIFPLGDPDKLIPMGPKHWRGWFSTLYSMSVGDKIEIGEYLPGVFGRAFITKKEDEKYSFEGTGELSL